MRDRLDDAFVEVERRLHEVFAVAGDAAARDADFLARGAAFFEKRLQPFLRRAERVALRFFVETVKHAFPRVGDDDFRRRRARIDAEEARRTVVFLERDFRNDAALLRREPGVEIFLPGKEPRERSRVRRMPDGGLLRGEPARRFGKFRERRGVPALFVLFAGSRQRRERAAPRGNDRGVLAENAVFVAQVQFFLKRLAQRGNERERPAAEKRLGQNVEPAREIPDALQRDGVENRRRDVFAGNVAREQVLDVRLGKNAAARGDRVNGPRGERKVGKLRDVAPEQRRHLVDERSRAAGAAAVHADVRRFSLFEENHLRVFPADVDERFRLRIFRADDFRRRDDFLHERQVPAFGDAHARRSRDDEADFPVAELRERVFEPRLQRSENIRVVAAVFGIGDVAVPVGEDQFQRRGADVQPDIVALVFHREKTFFF